MPDLSAELYEVRDLGDVTFSRGRLRGTGAGSGASFERTLWMANEWRDKKQVWWRAFGSEAEALEAAGLAKGKGSGVEVKRNGDAIVWTVRDGKAVRIDYYNNERQALEAAGLSE